VRLVVLLPVLFLIAVVPVAVFVLSGGGTHMTPILLEPFALPWSLFVNRDLEEMSGGGSLEHARYMDHVWILVCCAINFVLVVAGSAYLDTRAGRSGRPPDQ
jgi:hypothetical protein